MASNSDVSLAASYVERVSSAVGPRASLYDASSLKLSSGVAAPSADFAFGQAVAKIQQRNRVADKIRKVLDSGKAGRQLNEILTSWLKSRHDAVECEKSLAFADQWLVREAAFNSDIKVLHESQALLPKPSLWVVMADGLGAAGNNGVATDLGAIHHFLASEEDVNVLVLVTDPSLGSADAAKPRRDVGLYCLNYGTAYVAATSPAADAAQFERAIKEADAFRGPSVVLAYVPTVAQVATAAAAAPEAPATPESVAAEAVASGSWPLYRWDPAADARGEDTAFAVDSAKLRDDIKAFVDGANHLNLLSRQSPLLAPALTSSLESRVGALAATAEARLKASFDKLMGAFVPPPMTVLYGSDGGNAEGLAKRLANEAKARYGFTDVSVKAMDAVTSLAGLAGANAVFVVSTAGQGDMPSNARHFFKGLSAAAEDPSSSDAAALTSLRFAVFGLGDSHYWPKAEQRIFYNKASADLDAALHAVGAQPLVERGLGDDQDVGGFSAGWKRWTPALWAALGCAVTAKEDDSAGKVRGAEDVKTTSGFLRGTIAQGLTDVTTGALTYEDTLLT